jgi:hypothetical protein
VLSGPDHSGAMGRGVHRYYRVAPGSEDIPFFPSDFLFEDGSVGVSRVGAAYAEPTAPVTQGNRNAELFRYVRHLKANEVDHDLAWEATQVFNARNCQPPKDAKWLASWFRRAWGHRDRADFKQMVLEDTSSLDVVRDTTDDLEVIQVERAS